jgi:hypothetical protein
METLHTETYKGYTIDISQDDTDTLEGMLQDTGDHFACDDSQCYVNAEDAPRNISLQTLLDLTKTHDVGIGYIGSHSGIWLHSYRTITGKDVYAFIKHVQVGNKKLDASYCATKAELLETRDEDTVRELYVWLTKSQIKPDYIIACKRAKVSELPAVFARCNDYVKGDIYRFTVTEDTTGEVIDQCGGFEGDYDCAIEEAKSAIDDMEPVEMKKRYNKKAHALIQQAEKLLADINK